MAKVFIIDDDPLIIRMYQTKFQNQGYDVETAADGDEALKKVLNIKPDIILLDIMMPKVNGLEVLKNLKGNKDTKLIPVIILTNLGLSEADEQKSIELGAVTYIIKANYTPAEIVAKVKEILGPTTKKLRYLLIFLIISINCIYAC
jgi:DNA-binding response OmpR family regulator